MLQNKIRENIFLIAAVLLTFLAVLPLFHSGLFPMHDNEQIGRLFELDQALRAGQFPVRIISNLGFGYGYLLFNFYPPFVYYFGEIFKVLHFSHIDSMKIVMGAGFIFSAIFMYLFVKEYFGKMSGLIASVFYTYAPYHAVDLYVRGALPEFFSFVFIPAIFWSYLKLYKEKSKKFVVLTSLFNFLLIITHNLVALMSIVFIGVYVLFLLYQSKNKKELSTQIVLTLIFSFLLSCFFIIPALLENKHTMVSLLTTELADYNLHFVHPIQFWNSAWGYGGSTLGLGDGLSFKLGKLHVLLSAISILVIFYQAFKKKINKEAILFTSMLFVSLFIQTPYSKPIWDNVYALSYIQFPWRYLLFSAFFSSILIGFLFSQIKNVKFRYILAIAVICYLLFQSRLIFKPQFFLNNNDNYYLNQTFLKWDTSRMAFEYVPRGIATKKSAIGNTIVDIEPKQIANLSYALNKDVEAEVIKDIPQEKIIKTSSLIPTVFILNQYAYPGWSVFIDGKKIDFSSNNKLKLISFNLPAGEHIITAKFEDTVIRKISNLLSLMGLILISLYIGLYKKNEKT